MKTCKQCQQNLGEAVTVCPGCGADLPASRARIGRFVLLETVNETAAWCAYRGRVEGESGDKLIRVLSPSVAMDDARAERLRARIEALRRTTSPYLVHYDSLEQDADGTWFVVSEWVDCTSWGEVTGERLFRDPPRKRVWVDLFAEMAAALEALHQTGQIAPNLKQTDFLPVRRPNGAYDVKLDCSLTPFLRAPGATPEGPTRHPDAQAGRALDARSDVWSLGCILIGLAAGMEVTADNAASVIEGILNGFKPVVLHRKLGALLRSMVDDDPDRRPGGAAAVAVAIRSITDHEIVKWRRFEKDPWKRKRLARRVAWTAAAAAGLVLLATGAMIALERHRTDSKIDPLAVTVDEVIKVADRWEALSDAHEHRLAEISKALEEIDGSRPDDRMRFLNEAYKRSVAFVVVEVWEQVGGRRNVLFHNSGSAFLVSSDGYLLSNRHVVCPWIDEPKVAEHFEARAARGERTEFGYTLYLWFEGDEAFHSRRLQSQDVRDLYRTGTAYRSDESAGKRVEIVAVMPLPARLSERDRGLGDDVAVLKVSEVPEGAIPIPLALPEDGRLATRGTPVVAIGFPYGKDPIVGSQVVASWTQGTITSVYADTLAVNAAIHSGNSGGPVIDLDGRAVGIASAVFMARLTEIDDQGEKIQRRMSAPDMGRVLPITKAAELLDRVRANQPCWQGVPEYAYRHGLEPAKEEARKGEWRRAAKTAAGLADQFGAPNLLHWVAVLSPEGEDAGQRAEALDLAVAMQHDHFPAHFLRYCDDWQAGMEPGNRRSREALLAADWRSEGEFFGAAVRLIEANATAERLRTLSETSEEAAVLSWVATRMGGAQQGGNGAAQREQLLEAYGDVDPDTAFAFVVRHALDRLGRWSPPARPASQRPMASGDAQQALFAQILEALGSGGATPPPAPGAQGTKWARAAYAEDAFRAAANGDWDAALRLAERFLDQAAPERRSAHFLRTSLLRAQILLHRGNGAALDELARSGDAWHVEVARALTDAALAKRLMEESVGDDERTLPLRLALGLAAELGGKREAAIEHYREARNTLLEGHPEFAMALARLRALTDDRSVGNDAIRRLLVPRAEITPSWLLPTSQHTRHLGGRISPAAPLRESVASRVARWEALGVIQPEDNPAVRRAYDIYARVLQVADKRGTYLPTADSLRVVDSRGDPWAVALPDGHIVLSRRALDLCFEDVPTEEGDARLAFVLGHELGHLAADDFRHLQAYLFFADADEADEKVRQILREGGDAALLYGDRGDPAERAKALEAMRAAELHADNSGFLYAAAAGFRVDLLVGDGDERLSFFEHWVRQTAHGASDPRHPGADTRAHALRRRLQRLQDCVPLFDAGVLFLALGQYDVALPLFETYQRIFPSREVFNNLGLCYLRRSQPYGITGLGLIDSTTRARELGPDLTVSHILGRELPEQVRRDLGYAIACFDQACQADATYVPARLNLAVACLLLGADELHRGLRALNQVEAREPGHPQVTLLRWLMQSRFDSDETMCAVAIDRLAETVADETIPAWLLTHAAEVLAARGRDAAARRFRDAVRARESADAGFSGEMPTFGDILAVTWPVAPGTRFKPGGHAEPRSLRDYRRVDFHAGIPTLADALYVSGDGTMVAVVDEVARGFRLVLDPAVPVCDVVAGATVDEAALATGDRIYYSETMEALLIRNGIMQEYWRVHAE